MTPIFLTHVLAALSAFGLGIAILPRAKSSPLFRSMLYTSISIALWNTAQGLSVSTLALTWRIIAPALATLPLAAFLSLSLRAGFIELKIRPVLEFLGLVVAVAFGLLALSALNLKMTRQFVLSERWNQSWMLLSVPYLLLSLAALLRGSLLGAPKRRRLCAVLIFAGLVGFLGGFSSVFPVEEPLQMGALGTLLAVLIAAIAVTGRRWSAKNVAIQELLSSFSVVMVIAITASYAVHRSAEQPIILASMIAFIGIVAFAAYRQARKHWSTRIAENARLATLGQATGVLAHEVRNPLTTVQGALELLQDLGAEQDADERRRYLDMAQSEIRRVLVLINDSLTYARSPAPVHETFVLGELIRPVLLKAHTRFPQADIQALEGPADISMSGDSSQLTRMFENLVVNACQSTDNARVHVEVQAFSDYVRIAVEDSGSGVEPALRSKIFEPFFTTKVRGGGLGLAIVREIARRHGGDIIVTSAQLGGARFEVNLLKHIDFEPEDKI